MLESERISHSASVRSEGKEKNLHPVRVDCVSELRDWVQHVIAEAERSKNRGKRKRFLKLLDEL